MSTKQQLRSFHETLKELGPRQREVVHLLMQFSGGLSAWQISDRTKKLVHAVRPRLTELVSLGIVKQCGERWEDRTQRHEAIWMLVGEEDSGQRLLV